jgi:hypothetical protein
MVKEYSRQYYIVLFSGVPIVRKRQLGKMKKIFENITHTYLLAFSKPEDVLHLKGVSL